jgi:anti-sigma regulatory factor (Ser/Thr protein kinase)
MSRDLGEGMDGGMGAETELDNAELSDRSMDNAVELRFAALPEHVRTARLVAVALARRAGVEEGLLDEVRLAVGEACSRAVGLHKRNRPSAAVVVLLSEEGDRFRVDVSDDVGRDGADDGRSADGVPDADMGLAVLTGLVDDLDIITSATGGTVRMSWPVAHIPLGGPVLTR